MGHLADSASAARRGAGHAVSLAHAVSCECVCAWNLDKLFFARSIEEAVRFLTFCAHLCVVKLGKAPLTVKRNHIIMAASPTPPNGAPPRWLKLNGPGGGTNGGDGA